MSEGNMRYTRKQWMEEHLSPDARQVVAETQLLIPGYIPALDFHALTGYALQVVNVRNLKSKLADPKTAGTERATLRRRLKKSEQQLFERAASLGLTPASRLEIERIERALGLK